MGNGETAENQDQQQTNDKEGRDDIRQQVVVVEDGALRTGEGKAPVGAWHRLITDDIGFTIDLDTHATLLTCGHLMTQGKDISILVGIGIAEDGLGEELCGIGMEIVSALVARHEKIGIGIGRLGGDRLRETYQREVCGDDTNKTLVFPVKGFAIGGYHTVEGEFQRIALIVIDCPAGLPLMLGLFIPDLFEIFVLLFDDGRNGIRLAHSIDREVTAVLGEGLGFKTDRAAVDMTVQGNDIIGISEQRIGLQIFNDIQSSKIGGRLHDVHISVDALHGGADDARSMLGGLALDIVTRLHEEDAQSQHEDRDGHQQDAQTELPGK